jgi:tRNA(Ile)-lysidine synthase
VVDFDQVAAPLFVRAPLPGDRFDPLGMEGKSKALADFFRGRRVSRGSRARTPLVCDQRGIVWVAGHRLAERVKETSHTERRLWLSCWRAAGEHVVNSGCGVMSSGGNEQ